MDLKGYLSMYLCFLSLSLQKKIYDGFYKEQKNDTKV